MCVNYMLEIIGLDDWELTHPLPATAYKLMRKLQYLANKERFPERMNVSNGLLMSMVGCSEDSLIKARNQLIQSGLIQYKGQKKITPLYMIQYFSNNPAYNPKKQSMEQDIKQGYEQGISAGNKHGTYINNTIHNRTVYSEDHEQEQKDIQGYITDRACTRGEDHHPPGWDWPEPEWNLRKLVNTAQNSMKSHFGREATPAEVNAMARSALAREMSAEMLDLAISEAAVNAAKSPAAFVDKVLSDWNFEEVKTPSEYGEYKYMRDGLSGKAAWSVTLEEMQKARELRRAAHEMQEVSYGL